MHPNLRQTFNKNYKTSTYQNMLNEITSQYPEQLDFRVAESPLFISNDFKSKLISVSDYITQIIAKEDFKLKTQNAIPKNLFFQNEGPYPQIICIDFAVCKNKNGELEPQLIELQGFPSLFAYQNLLYNKLKKHYNIPNQYTPFLETKSSEGYLELMDHFFNKPDKTTILLEVYPEKQKTRIDFVLTREFWNIDTVCLTDILVENEKPYFLKNGKKVPIDRIYNRVIFDEIEKKYPQLLKKVESLKNLNVEWISNPNWFFRVSKFSMPLFDHKYIPYSRILSTIEKIPDDLENYVLKPLFSFSGGGVVIDVTQKDIDNIQNPENYILQKKVIYEPFITNPDGNKIKAEIRLMFVWPENENQPKMVTNLSRLSQGKMIGVDYNKNKDWVGGSICFFEM